MGSLWPDEYPDKAFKTAALEFAEFLGATSISYGDKTKASLEWLESVMK